MDIETKVVNLYKEKFDVYIGRAGKGKDGYFGNPFPLVKGEPRGSTIERFKDYFYDRLEKDFEYREKIEGLKGKTLGCFCHPQACHGDVIADYLNKPKYIAGVDSYKEDSVIQIFKIENGCIENLKDLK